MGDRALQKAAPLLWNKLPRSAREARDLDCFKTLDLTLDLKEIVVVTDKALYAKASKVVWQNTDRYSSFLLRLGTFHIICNLLSIIDKRYQEAGLRDLCIFY